MATEVTLPALGESVSEGTISRWLKAVGDTGCTPGGSEVGSCAMEITRSFPSRSR